MNPETQPAPAEIVRETKASRSGGNSTTLDQWRGLALVCVLFAHGFAFTNRTAGIGRVGVNLFFFISGVLVFRSLAKAREDGLALTKLFWKRRLLRLYPALVAYVLVMLPLVFLLRNLSVRTHMDPWDFVHDLPFALFYLIDYRQEVHVALDHLWSVSCEMQFYLLAPAIFLLGGKTTKQRNLVWFLLLAALMAVGFLVPLFHRTNLNAYKCHFEVAVWPMMLGFYCEYRKDWFRQLPARCLPWILGGTFLAFASIGVLMLFGMEMKLPVVVLGTFAFVPCFLSYIWGRPLGGLIGRVFTWLGERTYSIYLWQQPFTICRYLPSLWNPVGSLLAILTGGVWFRFFEQPFLSPGRKSVVEQQGLMKPAV